MSGWIEVTVPGALPLGLVRLEPEGSLALMGTSLKHVIVQLAARLAGTLDVTGGRAPLALAYAERFTAFHGLPAGAQIEVEWAIPAGLGLGSDAALGLAVGRALAELHNRPHDPASLAQALGLGPEHALELASYDPGGIFMCRVPDVAGEVARPPLARFGLHHPRVQAWAFAMFHPLTPAGMPAALERDRWAALLEAGKHLSPETGRLAVSELWPALENDDIERFGGALHEIHGLNQVALERAGYAPALTDTDEAILRTLRANGAFAWGRSLTGLAYYGLVRGDTAAANMKKKLLALMGHYNGTTMSTSIHNDGARVRPYDHSPEFRPL
jgi:predicted sugar kinase